MMLFLTTLGATITVEVGDDIILNANIITNDGGISLTTNHPDANETGVGTKGRIIMTTGTEINAGNQTIILSSEGDVSLASITTTGDVSMISTSGVIVDVNGTAINVSANNLVADANGGINIDTTITNLEASVSGVGNIDVTETDGITLTDVDTANGSITVMAGDTIIAIDVESLTDADGNDITLTSTGGGIEVDLINAGATQGDVFLDAQVGTITDNIDSDVDIVADAFNCRCYQ